MSRPVHMDLNSKIVTWWISWRRIGAGNHRVKTAGTSRGDSRVENWRRQPTREDCQHDHVGWRLPARPRETHGWRIGASNRRVKTAGVTTSVFFCWCLWSDQGCNGEVLFLFFFDVRVAFVAAIVDVIAGFPILPLMGRDCRETLCVVR